MARLSDDDIARLVASLGPQAVGTHAPVEPAPATARPAAAGELHGHRIEAVRDRLRALSEDGSIGRAVTQRLAGYLGKPVRCTSGTGQRVAGDGPLYRAMVGRVELSLRLDALLASALADAMIGGQGEASKVGHGSKTAVVARAAVLEMLRAIASALLLPEPVMGEGHAGVEPSMQAGGAVTLAMQEHPWQVGVAAADIDAAHGARTIAPAGHELDERQSSPVTSAFQSASRQLADMVGAPVVFEAFAISALDRARLPHGWLRVGVTSRAGGVIVLAADQTDAAELVNASLGAQIVSGRTRSALLEAGAETLLRAMLVAFAQELEFTPDELHHIVRLGDDAILADQACHGVEHVATWVSRMVRLRWLIPVVIAPDPAALATATRGR